MSLNGLAGPGTLVWGAMREWEEGVCWVLNTSPFQKAGTVPGRELWWSVRDECPARGPEGECRDCWKHLA